MSQYAITSIITGDLFAVTLLLEGEPIDLNYNGSNTYLSTNTVDVVGRLNIVCVVRGLVGTEWTIKLTLGGVDLFTPPPRTIDFGNRDILSDTVNVPTLLGAAKKGGAKKGAAKKGAAKKGAAKKGAAKKGGS